MSLNRRSFLTLTAAATSHAVPAADRLQITSVRAAPVSVRAGMPPEASAAPPSLSDFDPRRWRSFGPFSQLTGAILVQIRTKEGVTGYGMGGGVSAACHTIDTHLSRLL